MHTDNLIVNISMISSKDNVYVTTIKSHLEQMLI